jgi:hypothetical protein
MGQFFTASLNTAHFELKWARRPANEFRRLIGEEDMGNKPIGKPMTPTPNTSA